jgi:predicted ATPase
MKIESVRNENFRAFKDETVIFRDYTCFVGPNGAGKSTVLAGKQGSRKTGVENRRKQGSECTFI